MRQIFFMALAVTFTACQDKAPIDFLGQKEIPLSRPKIEVSNTIIDSTVELSVNFDLKGSLVRYTFGGELPNNSSELYDEPLTLKKPGVYNFSVFHTDWLESEVSKIKLYKKGIQPKNVKWNTELNAQYPSLGFASIFNNKKASIDYKDKQWLGFDDDCMAQIILDRPTEIDSITIGFLIDTKSWIFPPESIIIFLPGGDSIVHFVENNLESETKSIDDFVLPIHSELESFGLKVTNQELPDWHPGKGNPAWLFMDEWILNE